jgi:hypothetical protein
VKESSRLSDRFTVTPHIRLALRPTDVDMHSFTDAFCARSSAEAPGMHAHAAEDYSARPVTQGWEAFSLTLKLKAIGYRVHEGRTTKTNLLLVL